MQACDIYTVMLKSGFEYVKLYLHFNYILCLILKDVFLITTAITSTSLFPLSCIRTREVDHQSETWDGRADGMLHTPQAPHLDWSF